MHSFIKKLPKETPNFYEEMEKIWDKRAAFVAKQVRRAMLHRQAKNYKSADLIKGRLSKLGVAIEYLEPTYACFWMPGDPVYKRVFC